MAREGVITKISGPVVQAKRMRGSHMGDVVKVGKERLIGEIIRLEEDKTTIQVYEETTGIMPGEPVLDMGIPLSVELGPGLLKSVYDGIQRPLPLIKQQIGDFIARGTAIPALNRKCKWLFTPLLKTRTKVEVESGDIIGELQETTLVTHKVMIPPNLSGKLSWIASEGDYSIEEPIAKLEANGKAETISMLQRWPVRKERPFLKKLGPTIPLLTGQRVFDTFFPLARGGTASIPGGFGTGKCVVGETPILLWDGRLKSIKEIWEEKAEGEPKKEEPAEKFVKLEKPLEILSYENGKIVKKVATHIYKGKTSSTYHIKTRTGREVELTPFHKLLWIDSNLEVKEKPAAELREGDYLLLPRKIPLSANEQRIGIFDAFARERIDSQSAEKVAEIIKILERRTGSLKELAEKLGISYEVLIGYKLRTNRPTLKFVEKVQKFSGKKVTIKEIKGERDSKPMKLLTTVNEGLAEFLGLLLADGTLKPKSVHFYSNDERLLSRFGFLLKSVFGLEAKREFTHTVQSSKVGSAPLVRFLRWLGFPARRKSKNCKVPDLILQSNERVVGKFLGAYFLCDGSFSRRDNVVEISTSSKQMKTCLAYLFARLGIIPKILIRQTYAGKHYRLSIQGKDNIALFYTHCSLGDYEKFNLIKKYLENGKPSFRGLDVIPASPLLLEKIYKKSGRKTKELIKNGIKISNYTTHKELMNRYTFQKFARLTEDEGLLRFATNHLESFYCDRIEEIREEKVEKWVYDLTVPETHNFMGGFAPMVLHNTVAEHQLAKWSDAKIVVYIGCGERGNEMTDVLKEFPTLKDPETGEPLMNRTILIANTSNMPVAAREASIYTGITLAEYYRDMGYDVAVMADSTSRWAEALREISGRLEEMPGEEGYPAYLGSRLAEFYERAGRIQTIGKKPREGSISVVGAVSPPGGDFSEPVTQNTLRIVKVFWALDTDLADRRHFPSINWLRSYSLYLAQVRSFREKGVGKEWYELRRKAMGLLEKEAELQEIVRLVGPDALMPKDRIVLEGAKMIREDFLQQSAFHPVDTYCSEFKQYELLRIILDFYSFMKKAIEKGIRVEKLLESKNKESIARMKTLSLEEFEEKSKEIKERIKVEEKELGVD